MLFELEDLKEYEDVMALEDEMIVNDVFIKSFKSSHDATDSRNFIIKDETGSMAYITDTGYLNQKYFKMLSNLNLYLFECNHDIEMLEDGPYPKWLKTRVLSDVGHLSNNMAGFYLAKLIGPDTKDVLLIHLSETNNKPEIALKTVKETLDDYEVDFKNIKCACQDKKSEVYVL
jgi:phosphoribosyl 1,2-cyclic phosphodiesterase